MKMLKAEWRHLFHNKSLLIVVCGLLVIPVMYSAIFLKAMWDPYGSVEDLPVAVVNEDKPVAYNEKTLDVGSKLVSNLKDNETLDWHFTDRKKALDKLKKGDYYMVVVIPKDFSKNASSVLDEQPKKMDLEYYTDSGNNYIAQKIGASAATQMNQTIAESVTKEYATAIFSQLKEIGDGFQDGADGAKKLADGSQTIHDNLAKLEDSTLTLSDGQNSVKDGGMQIENKLGEAAAGAKKVADGVGTYTNGVSSINDGLQQYTAGASSLMNGLQQYTTGVGTLNTGILAYTEGVGRLETGLSGLKQGADTLSEKSIDLSTGSQQVSIGMNQLIPGINQLNNGASQLAYGSKTLNQNMNQVAAGSSSLKQKVDQLASSLDGTNKGAFKVVDELGDLQKELQKLKTTNNQALQQDITNVQTQLKAWNDQAQAAKAQNNQQILDTINASDSGLSNEQKQTLVHEVQAVQTKQQGSENFSDLSTNLKAISEKLGSLQSQYNGSTQAIGQLAATIGNTNSGAMGNFLAVTDTMKQGISGTDERTLQGAVATLDDGIQKVNEGSTSLSEKTAELSQGLSSLEEKAPALQSGVNALHSGIDQYVNGVNSLSDGATQIENGASQLTEKAPELNKGANQLAESGAILQQGSSKLVASGAQLASGARTLDQNSSVLTSGIQAIATGLPKLQTAVGSLNSGLDKLSDGTNQLSAGAGKLKDGSTELSDGSNELASKFSDAADDIKNTNTNDNNASMISKPVTLKNIELAEVANYGHGMAPYMMSLALFVGAMIFCLLFPIREPQTEPTSGFSWWLSKFSIMLFMGLLQSAIMVGVMIAFVGIEAKEVGSLYIVAILTSLAYMALIYFFNIVLGNVGRFITLVLMTLQLGGSAGTFPNELSNGFFQAIHPYLPMTYSINAYREAISLGGSNTLNYMVLLSLFVVFNLATIVYFSMKTKKVDSSSVDQAGQLAN